MAIILKRDDREDWLRWAIAFMHRGLWLEAQFEVHGPHDRTGHMWGDGFATWDDTGEPISCVFFAKARRSKYDPVNIRVYIAEVGEPVTRSDLARVVKISQLSSKAQRWLRGAEHTQRKLKEERRETRRIQEQRMRILKIR
jgi:hypothetical protein